MNKTDLIVHPVRSRIVVAVSGRSLTTREIAKVLPDVPVPTLYRHIRVLDEAGILQCTDERKVRGTVERSYTLAVGGGELDHTAVPAPEDHLKALANFATVVTQAYRSYIVLGGIEPPQAGMRAMYLSNEEHAALLQGLRDLLAAHDGNRPGEGRQRRLISLVDLPDIDPTETP
ncbi:ArsR family transcriptional regulator [bacterium]|nr:MAG: ArsR family transcriptional regulator [bacterium]